MRVVSDIKLIRTDLKRLLENNKKKITLPYNIC